MARIIVRSLAALTATLARATLDAGRVPWYSVAARMRVRTAGVR